MCWKKHTVNVGGIGKTLDKFQLKEKPLSAIIWILVYIFWPEDTHYILRFLKHHYMEEK